MNAPHDVDLAIVHGSTTTLLALPDRETDHVQRFVYQHRTFYELELLEHAAARLPAGSLVLDVGAYIGTHTLFFANVCGLRVHAFEPNPQARAVLQRNVGLNGLAERVHVSPLALGAEPAAGCVIPGTLGNMGQARVEPGAGDVAIARLDDQAFPGEVAALKIDVEGSELAVLHGARRLLSEQRPLLYVECATLDALADVIDFLATLGYVAGAHFNATPTIAFHPGPASVADVNAQVALHQHVIQRRFERLQTELGTVARRVQHGFHGQERERSDAEQRFDASGRAIEGAIRQLMELQVQSVERLSDELRALRVEQANRAQALEASLAAADTRTRALKTQLEHTLKRLNDTARAAERASLKLTTRRKLGKLARDPDRFFADAKHPLLRVGARRVYRELSPPLRAVLAAPPVRKLKKLYDKPEAFLRDAKSPMLRSLALSLSPWLESRRAPPAVAPKLARKLVRRREPDLSLTERSLVVLVPKLSDDGLDVLKALAGRIRAADELVVVAAQGASAPDLQRWASVLGCERARLYLHYGAPELGALAQYGLDRAHGRYCVLLIAPVADAPALCESVLSNGGWQDAARSDVGTPPRDERAALMSFADGSLALAAASRELLRERPWVQGGRLVAAHALQAAAEEGAVQLQQRMLPARAPVAEVLRDEPVALYFCAPGREPQLAEDLLAERPPRAHVFAANADALSAALPEEGLGATPSVLDLRGVPEFFVYPMPSLVAPFAQRTRAPGVLCMERRPGWALAPQPGTPTHGDRVSVIMTAYNAQATIDVAIVSILAQTHANLELIIVDDCSTDGTLARAQWHARFDRRVRVLRAPRNMGTYWCKNLGLTVARGKLITFHDSDDIALAPRIELSLALLKAMPDRTAVTVYHQHLTDLGSVPWVRGYKDRLSRVCLLLRRSALKELGYFDSVRVSADDELLARLSAAGKPVARLPMTYYFARSAEGTLTSLGPEAIRSDASTSSGVTGVRAAYLEEAARWHRARKQAGGSLRLDFPLLQRPFDAPERILPLRTSQPVDSVVASMATMPSRVKVLERTVQSLLPQVDRLNVYLNNFEQVPEFLRHPKIQVVRSQEHGDLKDNGKFFFAADLPHGYHLTVDDDIVYPPDYVQSSILAVERYGRRAVVGVHGVNLDPELKRYIKGRQVFHFGSAQENDRFVQLLGTGTVAYHTSTLRLTLEDFRSTGVADLWFAASAKRQNVALVSQRRRAQWLVPLEHDGETIFADVSRDDSRETDLARSLGPWNDASLDPVHRAVVQSLREQADYTRLDASGYDLHTIARLDGKPPVRIVLVVPGWNCAEHVERCWRSIVRQQAGHYMLEVVLVDDGSTDGTSEALAQAVRARPLDPRHTLRIVRHQENRGPAFSRWEAIGAVNDPEAVLAFLDMDDELFDSALASVAKTYLSDSQCWMTFGNWQNQKGRVNPLDFYTESTLQHRAYRRMKEFRLGHLRSFKRFLADALRPEMFHGPDGNWLMYCTDVALFFPLIEQCGAENIRYLRQPIYLYNERREGGTLERFGKDRKRELYRWIRARPTLPRRS